MQGFINPPVRPDLLAPELELSVPMMVTATLPNPTLIFNGDVLLESCDFGFIRSHRWCLLRFHQSECLDSGTTTGVCH